MQMTGDFVVQNSFEDIAALALQEVICSKGKLRNPIKRLPQTFALLDTSCMQLLAGRCL